jgi:lysophospholipase L1-like esterase
VNTAIVPVPKLEPDFYDWHARHNAKCREAAAGSHDLVFIGDSITHLFEGDPNVPGRGERVWREYYGTRNALNLGFGWDRTQNVLWRLDHGQFQGQTPRLVVLLIGTNNLTGTANAPSNTPAEICEGIRTVCEGLLSASPASRVLLMGVLPRGAADDPLRARIRELNVAVRQYAESCPSARFLDIGDRFLSAGGTIPPDLMNDAVHPTEAGYRIWAQAIEPLVLEYGRPDGKKFCP